MRHFYKAFLLLTGLTLISCESDSIETTAASSERVNPLNGRQLIIINHSDFLISGEVVCYGAQNNTTVNPNLLISGKATIPSHTVITYKNFADSSHPLYRINPWLVTNSNTSSVVTPATQTNNSFGQFFSPGGGAKFANWRYLKLKCSTNLIPGFTDAIPLNVELPQYTSNNSGEAVVNLNQYGLNQTVHISQSSVVNSAGNTVLTIESNLVNN